MSQSPTPSGPLSESADDRTSCKQTISNGLAAGIGAIMCAAVLGVFGALEGILRGSIPPWLHALSSAWFVTLCATIVVFIFGYVVGVSYAAVAGMYVIETIWKSLLRQPKPKRGWWLAPIDWLAAVGVWLGVATVVVEMYVSESLELTRARWQASQRSPVDDENVRLRTENEKLRAENETLRAQAKNMDG